jgi:hypothetical protein
MGTFQDIMKVVVVGGRCLRKVNMTPVMTPVTIYTWVQVRRGEEEDKEGNISFYFVKITIDLLMQSLQNIKL